MPRGMCIALLLLTCAFAHVHAQNPSAVVGPYLLDPLSKPRRWLGGASATLFTTNFGRQDYFGFAGGDTGLPGNCPDVLQTTIDLYISRMGGKPTPMTYKGMAPPVLSSARSFVSGASFSRRIYSASLLIIPLIFPLQVLVLPSPPTQGRGGMVTWFLPEGLNALALADNKPLE
jgi:hypothetical protein